MFKLNNNQTPVYMPLLSNKVEHFCHTINPLFPTLSHLLLLPRAITILTNVLTESLLFFGVLLLVCIKPQNKRKPSIAMKE